MKDITAGRRSTVAEMIAKAGKLISEYNSMEECLASCSDVLIKQVHTRIQYSVSTHASISQNCCPCDTKAFTYDRVRTARGMSVGYNTCVLVPKIISLAFAPQYQRPEKF